MGFSPLIIKPTRTNAKLPLLNYSIVEKNLRKGIETTVVLDLNILSKMNEVVINPNEYETSGLKPIVSMFNKLPIVLSPGFALGEADKTYVDMLWYSWEEFLGRYCPTYVDTPNATRDKLNHDEIGRKFETLPDADRHMHSIAYLSMLTIQVIAKRDVHLSPEEKFHAYVEYMSSSADMLSAVEAEVARYCFFDRSSENDIAFRYFSEIICRNFMKGGAIEKRLERALNSARDINYYRVVASKSNEELDGKIQDTWLLTADDGLKNLAKSIYFVPGFDGSDSKLVKLVRNKAQKKSAYWQSCDELFDYQITQRNVVVKHF